MILTMFKNKYPVVMSEIFTEYTRGNFIRSTRTFIKATDVNLEKNTESIA